MTNPLEKTQSKAQNAMKQTSKTDAEVEATAPAEPGGQSAVVPSVPAARKPSTPDDAEVGEGGSDGSRPMRN